MDPKLREHLLWHEQQEDKLQAILEFVQDIPAMKVDIVKVLKTDLSELKTDMIQVKGRLTNIEAR